MPETRRPSPVAPYSNKGVCSKEHPAGGARPGFRFTAEKSDLAGLSICLEASESEDRIFATWGTANFWATVKKASQLPTFIAVVTTFRWKDE
jgi:hypothetical protein